MRPGFWSFLAVLSGMTALIAPSNLEALAALSCMFVGVTMRHLKDMVELRRGR